MNLKLKKLLIPFYFGSIEDGNRLLVERELLTDAEMLIDYLDLKRKLEAAVELPQAPSLTLWNKLQEQIEPRKKMIFSISLGTLLVASIVLFFVFKSEQIDQSPSMRAEILFDSNSEHPASSIVL